MSDAPLAAEHRSVRMLMTEVYGDGEEFPLVIVSDSTLLTDIRPTDRVVKRHWVREGGAAETGADR